MLGFTTAKNVVLGYGVGNLTVKFSPSAPVAVVASATAGFLLGGFSLVALAAGAVTGALLSKDQGA